MTPQEFIRKWSASTLKERSGSQEHFIDLCRMLGQPTPADVDSDGTSFTFEKGASKHGGGDGWADVWKKGHFAWEYKGKHEDLEAAYDQLLRYRESLDNPPLLVVCDMDRFEVHTNFTDTTKKVYTFALKDLAEERHRKVLEALFIDPQWLKPGTRVEEVTEQAAAEFASLAESLRSRGVEPRKVAHFLDRILFCLFAEDVGLLPKRILQQLIEAGSRDPDELTGMLKDLFDAMTMGGRFGVDRIHYFDGGLFSDSEVIPLRLKEIDILRRASALNWGQIEPAIFGTLFERGLDPSKRSQTGAHYTDRGSILRVVEPVLMAPLRRAWAQTASAVAALLEKAVAAKRQPAVETRHRKNARSAIERFRKEYLDSTTVLDPACGSGNFLYVALEQLHELEKEVLLLLAEVEKGQFSLDIRVGPHMLKGIELNTFAQELAQVTVWIGHLQWYLKNGFSFSKDPVLKPIDAIECRDAILDMSDPGHPKETEWPEATVIIGNPPFLGGKKLRSELGDEYVDAMFEVYEGRVPREADLVTYWFEKARAAIKAGKVKRAGLLATNSIRGGASRKVLDRIRDSGDIFMAWSDEPWVVEGAAVRISLIGFDVGEETPRYLDGSEVSVIHSDLTGGSATAGGVDLTKARRLKEALGIAFMGDTKGGPFDIPGELARGWLALPLNPNGRPNSDVVRPWMNAMDLTRRPRGMYIIDFGVDMTEKEAALYEAPFEYVRRHVKPERDTNRRDSYREKWWIHVEPRPAMRKALNGRPRCLATPTVAKHRLFAWLATEILADHRLIVFARDDDYFLGILHSRIHETWSLRLGSWQGVGNDPVYTPTTTFETFPHPNPTQGQREAISSCAAELDRLRSQWLAPPSATAAELKKRTLTDLYNERPAWLTHAHAALDSAVSDAYGWPAELPEDDVLARLLELNSKRIPA
ncbi:MAG TPA: DNA methyltransferase [Verrucomicrobiae bacterium]|nr:DNA methyltransferase [Verrucomicrobiae bacterium]